MLSKLLMEELSRIAASFVGEGEVQLTNGRKAFLARGEDAPERCMARIAQLPDTQIPLSGVIEYAPGVYGFVL